MTKTQIAVSENRTLFIKNWRNPIANKTPILKVGSNNGMIGQHAGIFANGAVYWMGKTGGFYVYDGTVKSLPPISVRAPE